MSTEAQVNGEPSESTPAATPSQSDSGDNLYSRILSIAGEEGDFGSPADIAAEPDSTPETPELKPETEQPEEAHPEAEPEPEASPQPPTSEEKYKVKVDGAEIEVTREELLSGYQRQADYTRKTQEIAQQRKQLEEAFNQERQAAVLQGLKNISVDQLVQVDPVMTLTKIGAELEDLNTQIKKAIDEDDVLELPKLQYRQGELHRQAYTAQARIRESQEWVAGLQVSIPDFQAKAPKLEQFVTECLKDDPVTPQELDYMTNPLRVGKVAIKIVKLVNALYDQIQGSRETVRDKIDKTPPPPANRPGASSTQQEGPTRSDIQALTKLAKDTGTTEDWAAVIAARSKAQRKG